MAREFVATSCEVVDRCRDDIHPSVAEGSAPVEGFQAAGRDNTTLKEDLKQYGSKIEKLAKSKVNSCCKAILRREFQFFFFFRRKSWKRW